MPAKKQITTKAKAKADPMTTPREVINLDAAVHTFRSTVPGRERYHAEWDPSQTLHYRGAAFTPLTQIPPR